MNLGMPEMIFIFLLALILFGPKKLPEIGAQVGKFLAEFKRASNDFKSQLQTEIEKAGVDSAVTNAVVDAGVQKASSSFTQTLLPPAVTSVVSEIDSAHDRLMQTAKLAFEAQNFTLRPPSAPVIAATAAPELAPAEATAAPEAAAAPQPALPAEAPTIHPTPDPAPAQGLSAPQNS